jgi:signal transduction histidine kinase
LWKNAYDAYAKNVSLMIFDGEPVVAAVVDDGFGMNKQDFLEKWLVIGTESKIDEEAISPLDRFGLSERPRLGEKGIGRLSVAFLSPVTLVVSKKANEPFAAAMVDWRLFENPFLALDDIILPVFEFRKPGLLSALIPRMVAGLQENLTGKAGPKERCKRLEKGWERFNKYERSTGLEQTTADRIEIFGASSPISDRHLTEWPVFLELGDHGTAIFMMDVHRELAVWVAPGEEDDEARIVRDRLRETLTAFTDPYSIQSPEFAYDVLTKHGESMHKVLNSADVFGIDDFRALEHFIEGRFDEKGIFNGVVRAFGKDRGQFQFSPARVLPQNGREYLGPFNFCIGTFEQEQTNSTHDQSIHASLLKKASDFGGLQVYRDGLRVMPYGRPDADFFGIEERRTKHAGREFWAHRRSFGRVAFTHVDNPNLRDKAGREGLVDNRPRREMQLLVQDLLMQVARRFFGTDSDLRRDELPEIEKRNRAAREAADKARKARRRSFRNFLRLNSDHMRVALDEIRAYSQSLEDRDFNPDEFTLVGEKIDEFRAKKEELRLPPLPTRLGDYETEYRAYRDRYNEYSAQLDGLNKKRADISEKTPHKRPDQLAKQLLQSNQARLSDIVGKYQKAINNKVGELKAKWDSHADEDRSRYFQRGEPLLSDLNKGTRLGTLMNLLDSVYHELNEDIERRYESFIRSLQQLLDDIDLDAALSVSDTDMQNLQDLADNLHALAQTGISIEIIGHELETLDSEIETNLKRLPKDARALKAFKLAYEAHRALADRLRFLAPLKIAGYRTRETISGAQIADYMERFFNRQLESTRTTLVATERFRSIQIVDLPSRIYPVFMNLLNNSLYWLNLVTDRKIIMDVVGDKVIIADSGPGIDPDDIPRLFQLFFTRRAKGRGVGLYLCRSNLAVANHSIRYAQKDDPQLLTGASFIIEFRGVRHD